MGSYRRTAVAAGVFFVVAAVAAVIGLAFYQPLLHDANYVVSGHGADASIRTGAFFEVVTVIAVIGTAVSLFPVVRRQNETLALGYVAGRVVEGVLIAVGILSLLTVVTLRQTYAGAPGTDASALVFLQRTLVAVHDWTFLFGPNLALGVNTSMLAYLMYRSGLVPRLIAMFGLVGGPLIFLSGTAELYGLYTQVSTVGALTAVPVFVWEMSLAGWMLIKGFKSAPILIDDRTGNFGINRAAVSGAGQ